MRHLINFLCLALFSISSIQASHAIDLQPGDVVAPPPGIHIFNRVINTLKRMISMSKAIKKQVFHHYHPAPIF